MNFIKPISQERAFTPLLIFAITALFISGCKSTANDGIYQQQTPALPVIAINATTATTHHEFSASLEGSKDIEIRPQVSGILAKIHIDEGTYVKKGQPLFQIDSRPFIEQLNTAKAGLATAKANLVNAQINVSKIAPLVKSNVVSDIQFKAAEAAYDAAAANVEQAEAMVRSAQINLGYTLIKSPVDGYVGRIPYKMGSLVGLNNPEALTVVSDIKEVYAYFSMSENDFIRFKDQYEGNTVEEKIKQMPPVELLLSDGSVYPQKGKVQMVTGQFDNNVGAISFRAVFPNTDKLLRSGNTGKIRIAQVLDNALVIPQEATFELQDKICVYTLSDSNKVLTRPIKISGKTSGYYFVEGGFKPGEKIVYSGMGNLADGMLIQPQLLSTDSLLKVKPM
jgi:membrane fusion protein, multidrug efflux system